MHGSGPYLFFPAWWVSHLELDWQSDNYRKFFQQLGEHHTVVRYDRPGAGLSDRQRERFELEQEVQTLSELVEHVGAKELSLLGLSCGGPAAVEYSQRNSHRVSRLLLVASYAHGNDIADADMQHAACSLVRSLWGVGSKAILDLFDPDMPSEQRKQLGKVHRQSATADMATELMKLTFSMDAREAAKKLTTPTLVLHCDKDHTVPAAAGKRLAAIIPNAEFKSMQGRSHLPWLGSEKDEFIAEILSFTGAENSGQIKAALPAQTLKQTPEQFHKMGDVWALSYAGKTVHVKDARGLHDLAQLIANPGKELHVRLLASGEADAPGTYQNDAPVLDQQALNEYKQRFEELQEQKQEAAQCGDEARYERLETEQDAITNALTQGMGLHGKPRQFNSDDERARKSVTARIRSSINRIQSVHPELGEHLQASVSTGLQCSYHSNANLHWQTVSETRAYD